MDNFIHHFKDACIDNDFMLSTSGGADTLDGFEMSESNNINENLNKVNNDNSRLISSSPQHGNTIDLSNSLVDSVLNNTDINFLEDNILQDPNDDDHPFNLVGTSCDLNESNASSNLQFANNGLHDDYTQRQLQDEFELQMEREALEVAATQSISHASDNVVNLNESVESYSEKIIIQEESATVTMESEDPEAAILAKATDCRIRFSPLPSSVLRELKVLQKSKTRDKRQKNSEATPSSAEAHLKLKKPRLKKLRECVTCQNDIYSTVNLIHDRSIYCSIACIKAMVARCKQCCKPNEKIQFMDEVGTLIQLPNAQVITIFNLEEFLMKEPYVKPFVNFAKLDEDKSKSKVFDVEQGLKKEDAVRAAVKQSIHDQLMKRAKKSKVGVSRKATKDLSDQIEIELYRIHKSVKSAKYKSWCADFLFQITNDNNMFFKNVVTNVYTAKKLVTLTKEDMIVSLEETAKLNGSANASTINSPIKGPMQSKILARVKQPSVKASPKPIVSAVDMILGEEGADTTLKHNSHEFDSNCQICLRKVAERRAQMELIEKDREEEMEDRKRRKELGKNRRRETKSPVPRASRSRWNASSSSRRSVSPPLRRTYDDDDYEFDHPSPRGISPQRRKSPRRNLSRHDSPSRDFNSFSTPIRNDSPTHPTIRTPPPGVSPDRLAIRTISPQRSVSPRPPTFRRSASPQSFQHRPHSPPFHIREDDSFHGPRRGGPPIPYGYGPGSRPVRPLPSRFSEFGPRGGSRPISRPFYEPDILWTPGMPRPVGPRGIRPDFDPLLEDSWRREEQWRPRDRPQQEFCLPIIGERFIHGIPSPVLRLSPPHDFSSPVYKTTPDPPSLAPPPPNPWIGKDRTLWRGKIEGESFNFRCSLQLISNPIGFKLAGKLPSSLALKARVRPEPMWDFMKTIKTHTRFQTIVGVFVKEDSGVEVENYYRCFFDLKKTVRCGVFAMPKELRIKEAYLFQLDPSEPLPPVLLPIDGPGLPEMQQQKGILCLVIIKYMDEPFIIETVEEVKKEEPVPETLEEVLKAIERIDHPGELIRLVSSFIQRGNLTIEDKQTLQERCREKIEKQRKAPLPPPPTAVKASPVEQNSGQNEHQSQETEQKVDVKPIKCETRAGNLSNLIVPAAPKPPMEMDEEPQLQIDESREDEEMPLAKSVKHETSENSNHSGPEPGETKSESGEDMDISDDEEGRRARSMSLILPPPPPPPDIPSLMSTVVMPPPPPPPSEPPSYQLPAQESAYPLPPSEPTYFAFNDDGGRRYSNASDIDMEEGELNPLTPPQNFQQFPPGRGKNKKNKNRGNRGGGRGGGIFNNSGPSQPQNPITPPQNFAPLVQPDATWRRPSLPPQEQMFMSVRGGDQGPPRRGGPRGPLPFRGGRPPRGPPRMQHPGHPPQYNGPPRGPPRMQHPGHYNPNLPPRGYQYMRGMPPPYPRHMF